jgi:hypothetical protein
MTMRSQVLLSPKEFLISVDVYYCISIRPAGRGKILIIEVLKASDILAIQLIVKLSQFLHTQQFLIYSLVGYNLMLGKDFMELVL